MKNKFDINTAKKIINEYADKINYYMKQNELLKSQLDDITTTLNINKNILYSHILDNTTNKESNSIISELKTENERLSGKNNLFNKQIENLETKVKFFLKKLDKKITKRLR